jgi:uncharacterized protein
MFGNRLCATLLFALVCTAAAGFGQTASSPQAAAATDNGCPPPGQRGPRPGGPGGPPPGAAARPQGPPPGDAPAGPPKKHLLIWADTRNGIAQHDIAHAIAVIEELGYKSGTFDSYIRTDSNIISRRPKMTTGEPASGGPSLCNVDAIFFLGHREIELDAAGRADLLWFVHDAGKGFVAAHTGLTAFSESWPEFVSMLGGTFDQHPWGTTQGTVIVTDPQFPGLGKLGSSFDIKDEFYQAKEFSPDKSRVLLRLDTTKLDNSRGGVQAADYPYALAWAKMYGKGRVFYSSFAHAPSSWDDTRIQDMYLGAIKWALGLVDADVTSIPMPSPAPGATPAP